MPPGYEFFGYTRVEFWDRDDQQLLAHLSIDEKFPDVEHGYMSTYSVAYDTTEDGDQFEFLHGFKSVPFEETRDIAMQLEEFLKENLPRKRRTITGEVHSDATFFEACKAIDEIRADAKLETYIFKNGGFRSQLRFKTADGRQGDIYMSAGRLRLSFDGNPTMRVGLIENVGESLKIALREVLGNPPPEPGK